jgi:hypothetical protein
MATEAYRDPGPVLPDLTGATLRVSTVDTIGHAWRGQIVTVIGDGRKEVVRVSTPGGYPVYILRGHLEEIGT